MESNKGHKMELGVSGVMEMSEEHKYDFISVGQALHFFPIEQSLQKIKTMLTEDGNFVVFSYILKTVKSKNQKEEEIFSNYYAKVKPLFTFDRDDLHTYYSDKEKYPLEKVFPKVER